WAVGVRSLLAILKQRMQRQGMARAAARDINRGCDWNQVKKVRKAQRVAAMRSDQCCKRAALVAKAARQQQRAQLEAREEGEKVLATRGGGNGVVRST
ncbi:hypothetical protein BHM03_00051067, partial [Ensete ventricosum]